MKKAKFLGLALAAAMTLSGAGYAYWSDSLNINGSNVNTATMNIRYVDTNTNTTDEELQGNLADYVNGSVTYSPTPAAGITSTDYNSATITLNNLYPGANNKATLTMHNDSTIPVKFNGVPSLTSTTANSGLTTGIAQVVYVDKNNTTQTLNNPTGAELTAIIIHEDSTMTITFTINANTNDFNQGGSRTLSFAPSFKQFNEQ